MVKNTRSWLKGFEIVYDFYCQQVRASGGKPTQTGFWEHLGATRGKFQKWSKGQWPSAEDLQAMHEKFGFSYRWLVTGEGEMFDEAEKLLAEKDAKIERLEAENRKLNTRLMHDGVTDEKSLPVTAKAAGHE